MDIFELILALALIIVTFQRLQGYQSIPYFYLFIYVVVLFELFIEYYYFRVYGDNLVILNLYSRLCVYYYLFAYGSYFKKRRWMRKLLYLIIPYVIISFMYYLFYLPKENIDYLSYNIGMLLVFPLVGTYLFDVIYYQESKNVFYDPYFYFSFGILIFYTAAFPILGFINLLIVENPKYEVYTVLLDLGNIFLSLGYLGVALCSKKLTPSTGLSSHPS